MIDPKTHFTATLKLVAKYTHYSSPVSCMHSSFNHCFISLPTRFLVVAILIGSLAGCNTNNTKAGTPEKGTQTAQLNTDQALFNWVSYNGQSPELSDTVEASQYQNPVIAGFYPDPSITKKDDAYYLVNSSFGYWPGLPIFKSTDLVSWQPIGHALTNAKAFDFTKLGISKGIFAPTLRYHEGLFYLITTAVDAGGNFLITATDPSGAWSEPVFLPEIQGIDPDIFFDDDGRVYIAHNGGPEGEPLYSGHRAIWLWEYDPKQQKVIASSGRIIVNGGSNIKEEPVWVEGPHIYKKDGWYYLSCAEGGTSFDHSQVVFRSRDIHGQFVPYQGNPILTQRDLDPKRKNPIGATGHADFIQTPEGNWWAVFLGVRPYQEDFFNTGRETYMLPVEWIDGWPRILSSGKPVPYSHDRPFPNESKTPQMMTANRQWKDDFTQNQLGVEWQSLRGPWDSWLKVDAEDNRLVLSPQSQGLSSQSTPSFIGRRLQDKNAQVETNMDLSFGSGVFSGIAAFQNSSYYFALGAEKKANRYVVTLRQVTSGQATKVSEQSLPKHLENITLGMELNSGRASFYYLGTAGKIYIARDLDARILSTEVAGGFVGTMVGPFSEKH